MTTSLFTSCNPSQRMLITFLRTPLEHTQPRQFWISVCELPTTPCQRLWEKCLTSLFYFRRGAGLMYRAHFPWLSKAAPGQKKLGTKMQSGLVGYGSGPGCPNGIMSSLVDWILLVYKLIKCCPMLLCMQSSLGPSFYTLNVRGGKLFRGFA